MSVDTPKPDRIVVVDDGHERTLPIDEFMGLPLTQRVRYLLQDRAQFYCGDVRLRPAEALASLKRIEDE